MSIAAIWLPDLVKAIVDRGQKDDPDAARLHSILCAMELAQRTLHPRGTKYLLGKRGLPLTSRARHPQPPLTAEEVYALDCAASEWFRADGSLAAL